MSQRVSEYLEIADGHTRCRNCAHVLAPAGESWKGGALMRERAMQGAGGKPYQSRDHVLLRLFFCPGCGRQLASETAMKDDPFLEDIVAAS